MTAIGLPSVWHDELYSFCYDLIGKYSDRVVRDNAVVLEEAESVFGKILERAMQHVNNNIKSKKS
jgi:hypothetical protein